MTKRNGIKFCFLFGFPVRRIATVFLLSHSVQRLIPYISVALFNVNKTGWTIYVSPALNACYIQQRRRCETIRTMHETEDKFRINVMKTYQCFSWKLAIIQTESLQNNSTNSILKKAVFTEKVKNLRKLRENIESINISQFSSLNPWKKLFPENSWSFLKLCTWQSPPTVQTILRME